MIEWIEFKNFKALRNVKLQLGQFTLVVGANGSGKSTVLDGLWALGNETHWSTDQIRSVGVAPKGDQSVSVSAKFKDWNEKTPYLVQTSWQENTRRRPSFHLFRGDEPESAGAVGFLSGVRLFSLDAGAIAKAVQLRPEIELDRNGANLAGVLDRLRDQHPERFESLNQELARWIPEFDRILFETPSQGERSIALRTRSGSFSIKAYHLSHGTLIALALLTLAYLPEPPSVVCLEEPDRGLHPRLLRDVRDALYRLAYPKGSNEKRDPVQVIATTHNPYFLDLFREHPEEIVVAEKAGLEAKFSRLSDRPDLEEILGDAPLSEVWYSGVLGGVPTGA